MVVGGVGWWVVLGSGGCGKFMLMLVFCGYREQNLSELLLRSRSVLLLRSRSGYLNLSMAGGYQTRPGLVYSQNKIVTGKQKYS